MNKQEKENYTKDLFDLFWDGKRIWDKLVEIKEKRHIKPSKALNCRGIGANCAFGAVNLAYELDWKPQNMKVVVKGVSRPIGGLLMWFFSDEKDRCYNKAVKWLDKTSDEEQPMIVTVTYKVGDTPVRGAERNRKLTEMFLSYLDSIQPEVSQDQANAFADKVIREA